MPGEFHGQRNLAGCSSWGHKESDTTERLTLSASLVAQEVKKLSIMLKNLPAMRETQVRFLGQEGSLEKGMATPPVFFPKKFHRQNSLVGYSLRG